MFEGPASLELAASDCVHCMWRYGEVIATRLRCRIRILRR